VIDKQMLRRKATLDWSRYWTLEEINEWMFSLILENPGTVSLFSIGTSFEGKQIQGVKINVNGGKGKKSIFFESTIHANEWITTATTTWIINEFLTSTDENVRALAERYEWYFLPVLNVDGYAYTWSTDRLWRKTRRPNKNVLCKGADPNRNWDLFFDEFGTSSNPCSTSYAGDFAFSEPEMKQLSEFVPKISNLVAYFSFHSYGQLLMLPFAYTLSHEGNYDVLHEIGEKAIESIEAKHGKKYQLGSVSSFFGKFSKSEILNKKM
jgi:murein tripeptide amidase MpaA